MAAGEDMEKFALENAKADDNAVAGVYQKAGAKVYDLDDATLKRWQAQPGVLAIGRWADGMVPPRQIVAVGYHERVHGRWGWPEMGGWVFGFCNQLADRAEGPPNWAVVFALLQPRDETQDHTAMVMLWRLGRMGARP